MGTTRPSASASPLCKQSAELRERILGSAVRSTVESRGRPMTTSKYNSRALDIKCRLARQYPIWGVRRFQQGRDIDEIDECDIFHRRSWQVPGGINLIARFRARRTCTSIITFVPSFPAALDSCCRQTSLSLFTPAHQATALALC
jgi:hypothetical protein